MDWDGSGLALTNSTPEFTVANGDGIKILSIPYVTLAAINSEVDTALSDYDPPTKTEMDSGFSALNDVSTADVYI